MSGLTKPAADLASREFVGAFRPYQSQALAGFDAEMAAGRHRAYFVLPPGAGKTLLGLECARRLGQRTLVLSPNTAVQDQWARTWDTLFPSSSPDAPACATDHELTGSVNALTYQSIAVIDPDHDSRERQRVIREGASQELLALLHPNGRELIERAAASGPWTLVLDECHHLLATWGSVLRVVVELLGRRTKVIGLTATPPTELAPWQRALHDDLFGKADVVVPVPALVRDGFLTPYQELVYFTRPTLDEQGWLETEGARFSSLSVELVDGAVGSMSLAVWLARRVVERSAEDGAQVSWGAFERAEPKLARAALRFAHDGLIPVPEGAQLREEDLAVPDADDWVTVLADFCAGHLAVSGDPADAAVLAGIRRVLPGLGHRLSKNGVVTAAMSPVDRLCALSESKVVATAQILDAEQAALGPLLRALVLCDFELQTATMPATLREAGMGKESGSARLVLALLASEDERAEFPRHPVLVTGQTLACAGATGAALVAFAAARGAAATVEPFPIGHGLVAITGLTGRERVRLATDFFAEGRSRVLIGTRSLLGEGWDCAAVNVTIDLTEAATAGAITQMRGRSLRLDPNDPGKVADNWAVCCLARRHPRGNADYSRLGRKHAAYYAPSPDGLIERGISHCDPALSPYAAPAGSVADAVTGRALAAIADRAAARERWRVGAPYLGVEVAVTRVRAERPLGVATTALPPSSVAVPRGAPGPVDVGASVGGPGPASAARWRVWLRPVGLALLVAALVVGIGLAAGAWPAVIAAVVASGAAMAGVGAAARRASRALAGADDALLAIAKAVADALRATKAADRGAEAVVLAASVDGWVHCELEGVPIDQSRRFSAALNEAIAPLGEPALLIGRRVLTPPEGRRGRYFLRAALGLPLPGAVVWHAVPSCFTGTAWRRRAFATAWAQHVGPVRVLDPQTPEGQAVLDLFRGENPMSVFTQMRTIWQ